MEKAIHSDEHRRLCALLRSTREQAGLRQADVAARLEEPQSFVSKYENGERRLDLIELRQVCEALGTPLVSLIEAFESGRTDPGDLARSPGS